MTKSEIIHVFEHCKLSSDNFTSEAVNAAYVEALAALCESQERGKGCECCIDDCCTPLDWMYGLDHIFSRYYFCPVCGRKVKGDTP